MNHVEACLSAEKFEKAVLNAVEALWGWCKPAYVRERPDNAVLTSEEVL